LFEVANRGFTIKELLKKNFSYKKVKLIGSIFIFGLVFGFSYLGWFSATKYKSDLTGYTFSCESKRGDGEKIVFSRENEFYWTPRWIADCADFALALAEKEILVFHSMPTGGRIGKILADGEVKYEGSGYAFTFVVAMILCLIFVSVLRKIEVRRS